ncbi:MAG: thermonuclease family protein [Xanthobacteraceae bacterium]|jgi:endonuclease YncB( thermonuclease family)
MRHLSFAAFGHQRHGGALVVAGVIFAFGVTVGALVRPASLPESARSFDTARAAAVSGAEPAASVGTNSHKFDLQTVYPAEVVRIIDGDKFQARVQVWPGLSVDTKVRLRGIDAPELHIRCADEYAKAQAARAALETMLAAGGVTISRVGIDKYGGRVDAAVATRDTADVSAALLNGGWARSYDGGRRGSWC